MLKFIKGVICGVCITLIVAILAFSVFAQVSEKNIKAIYDDIQIFINGKNVVLLDASNKRVAPFIVDGSTYVPIRAVSEYLNKDVLWDAEQKSIYINEKPKHQLQNFTAEWYNTILKNMGESDIKTKPQNITQEYRVATSISFFGSKYLSVKIFSDRTGQLTFKTYTSESLDDGVLIYNESKKLTEEQTRSIIELIEENYFWEIPSQHPDEELGLDGFTLFAEGIYGEKYNVISMWNPNENYEIYKIYNGITHFANSLGLDDTNAIQEYRQK